MKCVWPSKAGAEDNSKAVASLEVAFIGGSESTFAYLDHSAQHFPACQRFRRRAGGSIRFTLTFKGNGSETLPGNCRNRLRLALCPRPTQPLPRGGCYSTVIAIRNGAKAVIRET